MAITGNLYNSSFESQFDEGRAQQFIIERLIRGVNVCQIVEVLAVTPVNDRVGFVTVQPVIQETDTSGVVLPQVPIYNVPFMRYQSGSSAVIMDPTVGDRGLALFSQEDITSFKKTLQDGPAATDRAHSTADALYIGGVLNSAPTQYVKFRPSAAGIDIVSPGDVNLTAGGAVRIQSGTTTRVVAPGGFIVDANMVLNGTMSGTATGPGAYAFAGPISAPEAVIAGVTQSTHVHGGVQPGAGNSTGPHS